MSDKNKKRGFAAMDPQAVREIASMGGKAAHAKGKAHRWDSKTAAEAGRKGGATRRLAAAGASVLMLVAMCSAVFGQSTVFNVPSQDVLSWGAAYVELDFPFRAASPTYFAAAPRTVLGLGQKTEAGLAVYGYNSSVPGPLQSWSASVALKRRLDIDTDGLSVVYGGNLSIPLGSTGETGLLGYGLVGNDFEGRFRIAVGAYGAGQAVVGQGNSQIGFAGSLEVPVSREFNFLLDGFTGVNNIGYFSVGGSYLPTDALTLYGAYQRANAGRSGDDFIVEIGYSFK